MFDRDFTEFVYKLLVDLIKSIELSTNDNKEYKMTSN